MSRFLICADKTNGKITHSTVNMVTILLIPRESDVIFWCGVSARIRPNHNSSGICRSKIYSCTSNHKVAISKKNILSI